MMAMADWSKTYKSEFFSRPTLAVARDLLGAQLCRRFSDGTLIMAPIVEVEAYTADDPACHAFRGQTPRCQVMFGPAGRAYVYFIYGMYFCLNVVTEEEGVPGAVLIRALGVSGGDGPGKLCRQWQITRQHNGASLMETSADLWIAQGDCAIEPEAIGQSSRVGISVAQERLWRFFLKDNPHLSVSQVKPHVRKTRKVEAR